ncbi:MAG: hypothetical protein WBQ25_20285 [Nitrososphaeraceae archaeon]
MKPTYLPANSTNKKQRIWALVSDGKYPPEQIASMVGTTVEYVWKETSRFKKATIGGSDVVSRSTTGISKRKEETSVIVKGRSGGEQGIREISIPNNQDRMRAIDGFFYTNKPNHYLDIPRMVSGELKTLYSEFSAGKKPIEIIADHGYHPDIVESEYHRFLRLTDRDINALLSSIIIDCETFSKPTEELKNLIKEYRNKGYLDNDDICELLRLKSEHERESELALLTFDPNERLPRGVVKLRCNLCNSPIPGVILDSASGIGRIILDQYGTNMRCLSCTSHTSLDEFEAMRQQDRLHL